MDTIILPFFFPFLATLRHVELPGQASDLSCSFSLSHSCGSARSLIHCARPGIEPSTQCFQDTADPVAHSGTPVPPILDMENKDASDGMSAPQHLRFSWWRYTQQISDEIHHANYQEVPGWKNSFYIGHVWERARELANSRWIINLLFQRGECHIYSHFIGQSMSHDQKQTQWGERESDQKGRGIGTR